MRNCDKHKTYDEAYKAWREFANTHKKSASANDMTITCSGGCSECRAGMTFGDCFAIWLMSETK